MADVTRLDPNPTLDGAFLWKAAAEGRFVVQKCNNCGKLWHPPRAICSICHSSDQGEQALSGKGIVASWTMPVHPPAVGFEAPPIVVLVDTEEGPRFLSNMEDVAPDKMRIGMKVKADFAPTRSGHAVFVFRPDED